MELGGPTIAPSLRVNILDRRMNSPSVRDSLSELRIQCFVLCDGACVLRKLALGDTVSAHLWSHLSPRVLSNRALCLCPLCLSFSQLNSSFQVACSTKCAMMMRCSVAALTSTPCRSAGASDSPESIWNPSCTQHPLECTGAATPRKATAPPYAAAILKRIRELLGFNALDSVGSVSASESKSSIGCLVSGEQA